MCVCVQTAYMLSTHEALRDMARRAGDSEAEKRHSAVVTKIRRNFFLDGVGLWLNDTGHPAAWREEVGHRRLRPDPWSYSIFLPIDAKLLTGIEAVQALHYTEWGLQRLHMKCDNGIACGQRHWTSNWVPSVWSAREFWPGDNYALALAYFQVGLPDGAFELLQGNLMHDMYRYMSPGALGSHNGGLDFNDIVNPAARTFIEGLYGIRPDVPNKVIEISPQLSPTWNNATLTTPYVQIAARGFIQRTETGTTAVSVQLKQALACLNCFLKVNLPLRATGLREVTVNGKACAGASYNCSYSVAAGFGQSVVTVVMSAPPAGVGVEVALRYTGGLGYVRAVKLQGVSRGHVQLDVGAGSTVERIDDPQRALASHSISPNGTISCVLSNASGYSLVSVTVRVGAVDGQGGGRLLQTRLFKLNVTADPASTMARAARVTVTAAEASASIFTPVDISALWNGNLSDIFHPTGGYLEPRPKTCASRIATDGYSPWSFKNAAAGQGDMPPFPNFNLVPDNGSVITPLGARFELLQHVGVRNDVVFVSQWENYPQKIEVPLPANVGKGDVVWLLISGSTNNMQTRLANAVIRFHYANSATAEESLELVPPINYWCVNSNGVPPN
eukprot:COSAG01_NODE_3998_length_5447_cov_2.455871_2_plen_616_part_00